jgi:hypothetical protein
MFDVGLKGNEEKPLVNSYAIFSGLKFKTTSYNHEGSPFFLVITIYQGSINDCLNEPKSLFTLEHIKKVEAYDSEEEADTNKLEDGTKSEEEEEIVPRVLISRISPPLYINSRKLAKENSSKKYNTVIEPFDLQAIEQDLYIRSNKVTPRTFQQGETPGGNRFSSQTQQPQSI